MASCRAGIASRRCQQCRDLSLSKSTRAVETPPSPDAPVADALGTEADFLRALGSRRDPGWQPQVPLPRATVTTMPTVSGDTAVSVSLTNALVLPGGDLQDLALYDTHLTLTVAPPGRLAPQRLGFAADDGRYAQAATVAGRGRGCVAESGTGPDTLVAQTLPLHVQHHAASREHGADLSFATLAANPTKTLTQITDAMRQFTASWDFSAATTAAEKAQLTVLQDQFKAETERFELGCSLLKTDARLRRAFALTNKTFAAAKGNTAIWRLFQIVFIVTELGALAGRETRRRRCAPNSTPLTCSGSQLAAAKPRRIWV